jgi:hypothetical protein
MAKIISNKFEVSDVSALTNNLLGIHTWEEDNRKYINLCNRNNPQAYGSFLSVMNTYIEMLDGWKQELTVNHFKLGSKTWEWVAKEVFEKYGVDWHPSAEKIKRCRYTEESRERRDK